MIWRWWRKSCVRPLHLVVVVVVMAMVLHIVTTAATTLVPSPPAPFTAFIQTHTTVAAAAAPGPGPPAPPPPPAPAPAAGGKMKAIRGKIKLNGVLFDTTCSCQKKMKACHPPVRVRVHQEPKNAGLGLTREELRDIIGSPHMIKMANTKRTYLSCLDGREDGTAVVATPGGILGEWLMAMSVIESTTHKNVSEAENLQLMQKFLAHGDGVVLAHCTDEQALKHLADYCHVGGQKGVIGLDIANPRSDIRVELAKDLSNPLNQGDYFMKAVLADPEGFYIRKELAANVIVAFYKAYWDKATRVGGTILSSRMKLEVYSGEPKEKAWINFMSNEGCAKEDMAPMFAPKERILANCPQAAKSFREQLGGFLMTYYPIANTREAFIAQLDRRGRRNMERYAEVRCGGYMPFYSVLVE